MSESTSVSNINKPFITPKTFKSILESQKSVSESNKGIESQKSIESQKKVCKTDKEYQEEIEHLRDEIKNLKHKLDLKDVTIKHNTDMIEFYKSLYDDEKAKTERLQGDIHNLAIKAIENAGTKIYNNTINNGQKLFNSLEPLSDEFMQEKQKYLTFDDFNEAFGIPKIDFKSMGISQQDFEDNDD